jgi:hypothetical protein
MTKQIAFRYPLELRNEVAKQAFVGQERLRAKTGKILGKTRLFLGQRGDLIIPGRAERANSITEFVRRQYLRPPVIGDLSPQQC